MQVHVRSLDWDSQFFGYTVGCIQLEQTELTTKILRQIADISQPFRLIYVQVTPGGNARKLLEKLGCLYVGDKIDHVLDISKKPIKTIDSGLKSILQYGEIADRSELQKLALLSGIHSRYNIDPNFTHDEFNRLYICWIDKSLAEVRKVPMCLMKMGDRVVGFVSFSVIDIHSIRVDLIAVEPKNRGQGIAEDMLNTVIHYAIEHGYKEIHISTQSANIPALNLYKKVGFVVSSQLSIYHLWQEHAKNSLQ